MPLTYSCPKCGKPCLSQLEAQQHCQRAYNTRTCTRCGGSGYLTGGIFTPNSTCPTCGGTGRVNAW